MNLYEKIKLGLEQAIEYDGGKIKAKKTTLSVTPLPTFTPSEIKEIRNNAGMTQALFAKYMGVSVKTIEAWESGKNQPEGSSRRLLALTQQSPTFPTISGIVTQ